MDKDFAQKVKKKRIRAIVVAAVLIAAAVYLVMDLNIEKADYSGDLDKAIAEAEELLAERIVAPIFASQDESLDLESAFSQQIDEAKLVAATDSGYTAKKEAYETLKKQIEAFRNGELYEEDSDSKDLITVTLEIRCDTLAADLTKLRDPALESYVPADGVILPVTEVQMEAGASVFDLLNQVCRDHDIQLEASYTPAYGSYYVEGINYLYEFDGGELSGWMYKVDSEYVNYGCAECQLEDGNAVIWNYTCDLGQDLGKKIEE